RTSPTVRIACTQSNGTWERPQDCWRRSAASESSHRGRCGAGRSFSKSFRHCCAGRASNCLGRNSSLCEEAQPGRKPDGSQGSAECPNAKYRRRYMRLQEIMTTDVVTIGPDEAASTAWTRMERERVR